MEDLWNEQENYVKTLTKFFDDDDGVMDSFNPLREEKAAYMRKRSIRYGRRLPKGSSGKHERNVNERTIQL